MLYSITELKPGRAITLEREPYLVVESKFGRKSQSKANMQCKLRNLKTGAVVARNFQGSEKVEAAEVGYRRVQYLFSSRESSTFMDLETYDQFSLPKDALEGSLCFLAEGQEVDALLYDGDPIGIQLPSTVVLKVKETSPGVRGDTATGGGKPATLATGMAITVPLFVNAGDNVRVNTETGEYMERFSE